ncbi:kinesin-like protein KIF28P isoform X1 [Octopus sinensis]|uniref:Kinesin-like protein n=1 Tax=Octopus sinensis TaxID=2607531 RepID=A0A7E6F4T7_9MOLL|nr:kinesin-like protein KIF28P isoform X1 [Octopus sinensis]
MDTENIKVAVRLRPFNSREKERNATLVINMNGSETRITDPKNAESVHKFNFDYSYWSHDGFKEEENGYFSPDPSHPNCNKYADQKKIFDDLGLGILHNAWEGYNSTMFAYGQTGSGKSWSIVGYGNNKGIVPQFCEKLFEEIEEKKQDPNNATDYQVICSMLELYNEKIRDLLSSTKNENLKICLHPSHGFYVKNLQQIPVKNFEKIKELMNVGTTNRTVAATNMNATSSRAHTMFGITFTQKFENTAGTMSEKSAMINLVDLAGSERASSTGATGDRLKEGAAINKSLFTLGNCISALAKKANGGNIKVPYMDSVLTKLLKNALGGNSKTIMVAAVSPADINYQETLSTLRYVNRAKEIKTMAKINESETDVLIRKLTEEIEQYKTMMKSGNIPMMSDTADLTEEEKRELRKEIEEEYSNILDENNRRIDDIRKTYAERLKEAEERAHQPAEMRKAMVQKKKTVPYIYNLNMDPQLTGHVFYFFENSPISVGKDVENAICLKGPSIAGKHASICQNKNDWTIEPTDSNVRLLVNGVQVTSKTILHHNDRIVFGTTQYYVMVHPKKSARDKTAYPDITFAMAQKEIGIHSGIDMNTLLEEDLLEMLPAIEEVNAISKELDAKKVFSLMLNNQSEVQVQVTDTESDIEWIWSRQEFLNRKYIMQEVYQQFITGENWKLPQDKDPFYDDPTTPYLIGSVEIFLKSLAHGIDTKQVSDIIDCSARKVGTIEVHLIPCGEDSKDLIDSEESFFSEPEERLNKNLHFKIKILQAYGLSNRFTDMYCSFKVYLGETEHKTDKISGTVNPKWNFSKMFSFKMVTKQLIDYLTSETITIKLWGCHRSSKKDNDMTQVPSISEPVQQSEDIEPRANQAKFLMELHILKRKQRKQETKLDAIKQMIELAEKHEKTKLSLKLIKSLFESTTQQEIDANLQLISQEKDDDLESTTKSLTDADKSSSSKVSIRDLRKENRKSVNNSSLREII